MFYRNPSKGGRTTVFSIVIDDDSESDDTDNSNPSDNPDGAMMSMLYSDKSTTSSDQKDGPLELEEPDKERELELAQEAFEQVIASLYKNEEIIKPKPKIDSAAEKLDNANELSEKIDSNSFSDDQFNQAINEIQLSKNETVSCEEEETAYECKSRNENSDVIIYNRDEGISGSHESSIIGTEGIEDGHSNVILDKSVKVDLDPSGKDSFNSFQNSGESECSNRTLPETREDETRSDTNTFVKSDAKKASEDFNSVDDVIKRIRLSLNEISSISELESARDTISVSLDRILSEYNSMKLQLNKLKSGAADAQSGAGIPSPPPPPMILPPPPPPPPPPPLLISSKKIGNDGMPNENFSSMLQKAKVKITPGENSESGVEEIEVRIKRKGKTNLKADMMSQLRNALNNRKNRKSLKDKYEDLH